MKKNIKLFALSLGLLIFSNITYSQQINNLYFLENAPVRHYLNPSFQPMSGFYLGFPFLGYSQYGFGNNSFTISSLATPKDDVFKSIRPTTLLNTDIQVNLLDFGFRSKDSYFSLGITTKASAYSGLPKDMFKMFMYGFANEVDGVPQLENNVFDFKSLTLGGNLYNEVALGYSKNINEKWSYGFKLKYLHGLANLKATFDNFDLTTGVEEWRINANGSINSSSAAVLNVGNDLQSIDFSFPSGVMEFVKPAGIGGAVDLGATYKPFDFLTLGAAVTDLGLIRWTKNTNNTKIKTDYVYDGLGTITASELFDGIDNNAMLDTLVNNLKKASTLSNSTSAYSASLSPKVNASAEIGVLKNAISLGLLSTTMFHNKSVYQDITTSLNLRPANWLNLALSYSFLNGRGSNIGAGLSLRLGIINAFFTTDYFPVNHTRIPLSLLNINPIDMSNVPLLGPSLGVISDFKVPYKTDRFNFAMGFNIVFGNKRDRDRDGVSDRRDESPDTPFGVIVDKKGRPLDTDGDKIHDYLDKCPDTPKEAYNKIDADGCPVDTDGDGVYDYLDKCPDTPVAAYGKIDENGCPKDSDKDGVVDYLDKCESTPEGVQVDSLGCPLDTDGDNVPDYKDKCPETPVAARGLVDSVGCPLDTDFDGVYDYLDLCPNTIAEARANVDKNGCPKDTDLDGVADYLDKCPDTPVEAKGTVDENGCPRDTDGDGVFDYLDNCPRLAGVVSNKGCPEIKKEVRQLFQKALQGIQFETAKSTIKPVSFKILDQVAVVLTENPTYLVEIQGHTDNVGKKDANQILSQNRANAVRNYLINKGIDEKRMTANGYGDTKPVLPNTSVQNKAKNRRVEFVVSFEEVKVVEE